MQRLRSTEMEQACFMHRAWKACFRGCNRYGISSLHPCILLRNDLVQRHADLKRLSRTEAAEVLDSQGTNLY
jgi:hypothetical protein